MPAACVDSKASIHASHVQSQWQLARREWSKAPIDDRGVWYQAPIDNCFRGGPRQTRHAGVERGALRRGAGRAIAARCGEDTEPHHPGGGGGKRGGGAGEAHIRPAGVGEAGGGGVGGVIWGIRCDVERGVGAVGLEPDGRARDRDALGETTHWRWRREWQRRQRHVEEQLWGRHVEQLWGCGYRGGDEGVATDRLGLFHSVGGG